VRKSAATNERIIEKGFFRGVGVDSLEGVIEILL
jgi:hypothetical protein